MGRERIASAERTAVILKTVRTIKGFCREVSSLPTFALYPLIFYPVLHSATWIFLLSFAHCPSIFYPDLHTTLQFFTQFCTLPLDFLPGFAHYRLQFFPFPCAKIALSRCRNCIYPVQKLHVETIVIN